MHAAHDERAEPADAVADDLIADESATKASKAHRLVALENLGQPQWAPRDYASFAREGFMQNAIVYRSVRMVAEAAASIPLLLYDGAYKVKTVGFLRSLSHIPASIIRAPTFLKVGTAICWCREMRMWRPLV